MEYLQDTTVLEIVGYYPAIRILWELSGILTGYYTQYTVYETVGYYPTV